AQGCLLAGGFDRFDPDQLAEPQLECALHHELRGCRQLGAVRRKHQLQQPGTEGRAVDALAGRREEQLLDQAANVLFVRVLCGAAARVELVWKRGIHCAFTRNCVSTMFTPVPFGTQIAWLSCSNTGKPPESTRVAAVIHWAVTHGIGVTPATNGQPATT